MRKLRLWYDKNVLGENPNRHGQQMTLMVMPPRPFGPPRPPRKVDPPAAPKPNRPYSNPKK